MKIIKDYVQQHKDRFINELIELLKIPSVSADAAYHQDIINTADAVKGIKTGKIGYLGMDVYEKEKGLFFVDRRESIPNDPVFAELLTLENVLITGHQAFLTETALGNISDTTLYNIDCFAKGERSLHALTA